MASEDGCQEIAGAVMFSRNRQGNRQPLRMLFAAGPGDVVDSFEHWRRGESFSSETSITYSSQFFSFCRDNDVKAHVVSWNPRTAVVQDEGFTVENRPKLGSSSIRGLRFHLRELAYGLLLVFLGVRFRANIVLLDSGASYWFVFGLFKLFGIEPINNFHNAFWPAGYPPRKPVARFIQRLDGLYLRWCATVSMGVSPECQRQAEQLAGKPLTFFQYTAMYPVAPFADRVPAEFQKRPFRIVFAGRVERNKGVFDILAMAQKLNSICPGEVVFEICGDGTAFEQVAADRMQLGLKDCVILHGKLKRNALLDVYRHSHLVIVPTTSEFNEAFAMVVAEAILLDRPVLSNPVVPACEILSAATVIARTDDVDDYVARIVELMSDEVRYGQLCSACEELRGRFFDPANGKAEMLGRAIDVLRPGWRDDSSFQPTQQNLPVGNAASRAL